MKLVSDTLLLSSEETGDFLKKAHEKNIPFKFTARGMSMSPFICSGDTITIQPYLNRKCQIGDIVAYINPDTGHLIVHRIIKKNKEQYLLKGDNKYHPDGYCPQKNVYGYVNEVTISIKKFTHYRKIIRNGFLFFGNFKKALAFLSLYNVTTPICRAANKVLNEKIY